jgi:predicted nucleotidyltransferase
MKAIKELISSLDIAPEYQTLVDEFINTIKNNTDEIHSIYMCGSIPKGSAVPYKSDADFTVVLKNQPSSTNKHSILNLTKEIQRQFAIVPKIDVPICSVQDVLDNPYDWGFWIKIVSICIYGPDLSNQIPDLYPSIELQHTYYKAAIEQISKSRNSAISQEDDLLRADAQQKTIKKIIRTIYSLYLLLEESWTEDIDVFISVIKRHVPKNQNVASKLIQAYRTPTLSRSEFMEITEKAMDFYFEQYGICQHRFRVL